MEQNVCFFVLRFKRYYKRKRIIEVLDLRKTFAASLCVLVMVFSTANAFALEIVPNPVSTDLGDGLVFWQTLPEADVYWEYSAYEVSDFPKSGLYQNGELLYTVDVDYDWWWSQLYFADDAMTFLYVPVSGGSTASKHAIRFYEQGVVAHEYEVISLLQGGAAALLQPRAGTIETTPRWDLPEQRYYNRENNILSVTTTENITITFDLATGVILSTEETPSLRGSSVVFIGLGAIICVIIVMVLLTRLRHFG
jgi:hypothetical protein